MPRIAQFLGIVIRMHVNDHPPPHFHAIYGEHEALVRIDTLEVIAGALPPRVRALTLEWASAHRPELLRNWELASAGRHPDTVPPLG